MGFVGLKTNKQEEKEIQELENLLRSMDPLQKIGSRSAAIKESVRIALFHIKQTYFYNKDIMISKKGLTGRGMSQTAIQQARYIKQIKSSDIDLDGKRKEKKGHSSSKV